MRMFITNISKMDLLKEAFTRSNDELQVAAKGLATLKWEVMGDTAIMAEFVYPMDVSFFNKILASELEKQCKKLDPGIVFKREN